MPKGEPKTKQQKSDLRQPDFLARYLDPTSPTYNNIYQSAIDAGYSKEYAENFRIKQKNWVSDAVGYVTKEELVKKAKKVLNKSLDSADEKLAQDTAKFVAKTDIEFSEKTDITSNGKEIQPLLVKFVDDAQNN